MLCRPKMLMGYCKTYSYILTYTTSAWDGLMKHQKTISLDEDTAKIAARLPNFSRFVRQCLVRHASEAVNHGDLKQDPHVAPSEARIWGETKDKCNPLHRLGRCPTCWGVQ